jgi:hypothetical protein
LVINSVQHSLTYPSGPVARRFEPGKVWILLNTPTTHAPLGYRFHARGTTARLVRGEEWETSSLAAREMPRASAA